MSAALSMNLMASVAAAFLTYKVAGHPSLQKTFIGRGLCGRDMHKTDLPVVAESMGVVAGLVYLVTMFLLIPFLFLSAWSSITTILPLHAPTVDNAQDAVFPLSLLTTYLSAMLSLSCMTFLGFADDVLDLRWRYKLLLPTIASVPLLVVYYVSYGITYVVVPMPLRSLLGHSLDLGALYYVYMGMLAVFCTNSINILAGINGVEVGQSLVIALTILSHDLIVLSDWPMTIGESASTAYTRENHMFSAHLLIPFVAVSLSLYSLNRWPAKVFVGDTYCYFAGMLFAVVGILGHFSKTMLLFFIPQVFNFLYSLPQLFRFVPCPRHRMPRYDSETGLLYPSMTEAVDKENPSRIGLLVVQVLAFLGLLQVDYVSSPNVAAVKKLTRKTRKQSDATVQQDTDIMMINNLTVMNLLLVKFGPMREDTLCRLVLIGQILFGSLLPFVIRYWLVRFFYF